MGQAVLSFPKDEDLDTNKALHRIIFDPGLLFDVRFCNASEGYCFEEFRKSFVSNGFGQFGFVSIVRVFKYRYPVSEKY